MNKIYEPTVFYKDSRKMALRNREDLGGIKYTLNQKNMGNSFMMSQLSLRGDEEKLNRKPLE